MKELNKRLIDLLNQNLSINQIAEELNVTNKQLYYLITCLKNKGIEYKRKYYATGDIFYTPQDKLETNNYPKEQVLLTSHNNLQIKALLLSDLHIGNFNERLDLLNKVYDYATKENINLIFIAGDIIDGIKLGNNSIHESAIEQIEYFAKTFPFSNNILVINVLGNHDLDILKTDGINFLEYLNSYRHDFVNLGYKQGVLKIKNDKIYLTHYIASKDVGYECPKWEKIKPTLILEGHHHFLSFKEYDNYKKIKLPSLSDIYLNDNPFLLPSMVKMTLNFKSINGYIESGVFEQFILEPEIIRLNEFSLLFNKDKIKQEAIANEIDVKILKK